MFDRKIVWGALLLMAALATASVMTGCGSDNNEGISSQQTAFLSGAQANPNSNSLATGTATVSFVNLNDDVAQNRQVRVRLVTEGLINVTTVELHLGQPGETGPVLFTLYSRANVGQQLPTDFTRVIRASDWVPVAGINTFEEFVNALRAGNVYILVNTVANPNGEIRGQIGASRFALTLTGRPTSTLIPTAVVTIDQLRQAVRVQMPNVGIPDATSVRLVFGGLGGERLFSIREQNAGPLGAVDATVHADQLNRLPGAGINTFNDFLAALFAGKVFLVVTTAAFPGGEFIAQIVPTAVVPQVFIVAMSDGAFTPSAVEVPAGSIIRFRNDSAVPLTVLADATNLVAGGPNSGGAFPLGIPAGETFDFQVPVGTVAGTSFFYHEPVRGTAGTGTVVGTGMAGVITVS
jgi:hypothetical protein